MPIQYPDYPINPIKYPQRDYSSVGDLFENIAKGFQIAKIPEDRRLAKQKAELEQSLLEQNIAGKQLSNQYYGPSTQADIDYKNAQTKKALDPYYLLSNALSGDTQNAFQLAKLKQLSESNPSLAPQYEEARKAFDLHQRSLEALNENRAMLTGSAPYRYATTPAKFEMEKYEASQGTMPHSGGTIPLSQDDMNRLSGQLGLGEMKSVSDPKTRERILYSVNLDKTLDMVDPDILTSYSGMKGGLSENINKLASQVGFESENYDKYLENVTAATIAAKQLRQFLGDSVQPAEQDSLAQLTKPSTWHKSPAQAARQFNKFKEIYDTEKKTLRSAVISPEIYRGSIDKNIGTNNNNSDLESMSDDELRAIAEGR